MLNAYTRRLSKRVAQRSILGFLAASYLIPFVVIMLCLVPDMHGLGDVFVGVVASAFVAAFLLVPVAEFLASVLGPIAAIFGLTWLLAHAEENAAHIDRKIDRIL